MCRLAASTLLGLLTVTQSPFLAAQESVDQEIRRLESAWNEAHLHGDLGALNELWSSDITVVVPDMPLFSKTELLEMWRSVPVTFSEYATTDLKIRVFGDSAVTTGRLHRARNFAGREKIEDWLFTKAYARHDGKWQVVAFHSSTVPSE
ncbi:MAG: nuclear transport factor 2 family protein [Thermoanaerobaculia bacterium]|nr:nuclear transport factor 2 family protein [Thermoanaerobaculia bacterium]